MREKDIQSAILRYLHVNKIFCWKYNNIGIWKQKTKSYIPSNMLGVSDIIGILPDGKFLAIEIKRPSGKLTYYQETFINDIKERNGIAFVAYDVSDVEKELKKLGYIK